MKKAAASTFGPEEVRLEFGDPPVEAEPLAFPCSASQERCWFIDALKPGNPTLNIALRWEIKGRFAASEVEEAFRRVIARHEILRTSFAIRDGEPYQQVHDAFDFKMSVIDLRTVPDDRRRQEADALTRREARVPFDLRALPLIRVTLLPLANDDAALLVTLHQIVFDGWSIRVLFREIGELLSSLSRQRDASLPELPLQYGDFSLWQREFLASGSFAAETTYWTAHLSNLPYLEVAPDRPRPAVPSYRGELLTKDYSIEHGERMEACAKQHGITSFTLG
jgi:hypothetical protein